KHWVAQDPFDDRGLLGDDSTDGRPSDDEDDQDDTPLPQVYFFPSGESTPVTFTLRSRDDFDLLVKRQLTALGRVRDPLHDEPEEVHTAPQHKPDGEDDDGLFDDDFLQGDDEP